MDDNLIYKVKDPDVLVLSNNVPALTTMMHRVCANDETKFEEAVRLLNLFMKAAYEAGSKHTPIQIDTALALSLGNNSEFVIDRSDKLWVVSSIGLKDQQAVCLGNLTKKKIEDLCSYLNRLVVHAPKD